LAGHLILDSARFGHLFGKRYFVLSVACYQAAFLKPSYAATPSWTIFPNPAAAAEPPVGSIFRIRPDATGIGLINFPQPDLGFLWRHFHESAKQFDSRSLTLRLFAQADLAGFFMFFVKVTRESLRRAAALCRQCVPCAIVTLKSPAQGVDL
jgi:hypothetical protein